MNAFDVIVVGAGPAGAVAALNLAPLYRVLLIDRRAAPAPRIGESLPPAARRLLTDMGLWSDFLLQGHEKCYGNRAFWNGAATSHDFLRDPDGVGWHLNRADFENWLCGHAVARGAQLRRSTTLKSVTPVAEGWQLAFTTASGEIQAKARLVVDASGRPATLARRLGARHVQHDRLVCHWLYGHDTVSGVDSRSSVEAVEHGWWYSAALPGMRRVLAFHTDADLPVLRRIRSAGDLLQATAATREIAKQIEAAGFVADPQMSMTAAHTSSLTSTAGENWCAIGDAALSFDPLSSQGLFNALYTGLAGAMACDWRLRGERSAFDDYRAEMRGVRQAYQSHLEYCYCQETRWPDSVFWRRRQRGATDVTNDNAATSDVRSPFRVEQLTL